MNTHDPAFRRAFRRGKRFYGANGVFTIIPVLGGDFVPIPFAFHDNGLWPPCEGAVQYWNPDGKRWRRFNPEKMKKYIEKEGRS